jgi:hypothetical protein
MGEAPLSFPFSFSSYFSSIFPSPSALEAGESLVIQAEGVARRFSGYAAAQGRASASVTAQVKVPRAMGKGEEWRRRKRQLGQLLFQCLLGPGRTGPVSTEQFVPAHRALAQHQGI